MKVEIGTLGDLKIVPETTTEAYLLKKWVENMEIFKAKKDKTESLIIQTYCEEVL